MDMVFQVTPDVYQEVYSVGISCCHNFQKTLRWALLHVDDMAVSCALAAAHLRRANLAHGARNDLAENLGTKQ
jgi:hypothetical protein